jgi:hypothetical protein
MYHRRILLHLLFILYTHNLLSLSSQGVPKIKIKKNNLKYKTEFSLDNLRELRAFLFAVVTKSLT